MVVLGVAMDRQAIPLDMSRSVGHLVSGYTSMVDLRGNTYSWPCWITMCSCGAERGGFAVAFFGVWGELKWQEPEFEFLTKRRW